MRFYDLGLPATHISGMPHLAKNVQTKATAMAVFSMLLFKPIKSTTAGDKFEIFSTKMFEFQTWPKIFDIL